MSLKINIEELRNIRHETAESTWKVEVRLKGFSLSTSEASTSYGTATFNQILEFVTEESLDTTDVIYFAVFECKHHQRGTAKRKVGEFSMQLRATILTGFVDIENRITDSVKNQLLEIRLKFSASYESTIVKLVMSDSSDEDTPCGEGSPLLSNDPIQPLDLGNQSESATSSSSDSFSTRSFELNKTQKALSLSPWAQSYGLQSRVTGSSRCTLASPQNPRSITTMVVVNEKCRQDLPQDSTQIKYAVPSKGKREKFFLKKRVHVDKSSTHKLLKAHKLWMTASSKVTRKLIRRHTKDSATTSTDMDAFDDPDGFGEEEDGESVSSTMEEPDPSSLHPYSRKFRMICLDRIIKPGRHNLSQDYLVGITVVEIRKLQGLNLNPMVVVQIGDTKKKTSEKEGTNCPYFDEYFVFDYNLPIQALLEKIITFTVYNTTRLTKGKMLGQFKIELSSIYASPGHQIHHKWAPLAAGPEEQQLPDEVRGFLQCNISITGKDAARPSPPKPSGGDANYEKNLLLPPGCGQFEQQRAKIQVKIYRAEDLPFMNLGILANMKKAFTGETKDLVDPYVQVSFAGFKCKTSVKKGQCTPVWNEELTFTESLPALCSTVQIQLRDKVSVTDDIIGTYYIDLMNISNTGTMGFLPTFGPCWVNLYGSNREVSVLDEHRALNSGEGEGIAYRGRLLIAITTEAVSQAAMLGDTSEPAEGNKISAVPESALPPKKDLLLIGTLFEANMINQKYKNQPIHFELSIGYSSESASLPEAEYREIQRYDSTLKIPIFDSSDKTPLYTGSANDVHPENTYSTVPTLPATVDKNTYFMDFPKKPCLYVQPKLEDNFARMHSQNLTAFLAQSLTEGITDVKHLLGEQDIEAATNKLSHVASQFASLCVQCSDEWKLSKASSTRLDKERRRVCKLKLDYMSSRARTIKSTLTMTNLKDKLYQCQEMLHEIHKLSLEPQDSLPDVFVWMLVAGKRIAYFRIPARDILYSDADLKRGRLCGKLKTLTLKLPGKRSQGQSGWQMQAKLTMILWLGLNEERDKFYASLPPDCNPKTSSIPRSLSCASTSQFQLRAHLYQARALIGSDSSGLSDPYATVTFGEFVAQTKVISETLSPTWNQMLIIDDITLPYPAGEWLKTCPPMITIEIYDHDSIASAAGILTKGSPEYLGRAFAYPLVKLCDDPYKPPMFPALLQWWHIQRGQSPSGELLASFELFQKPFDAEEVYKLLLTPRLAPKHRRICSEGLPLTVSKHDVETAMRMEKNAIIPIPGSIRPVFSKHRIEVLFWGMRDLKKLQFTAVTRPKIDVECAGKVISSIPLTDANINPNFSVTVQHTEVDLPEDQTYCPPITIRCVDCRNFGRFVLVGTHTISSLQRYLFKTKASLSKDNLDAIKPAGESDAEVASVSELFKDKPSNGGIPTVLPSGTTQANATGNVAAGFKLLNNTSTAVDTSQSINSGLKNFGMELSRFGPKRSSSRKMRKPIKVKDKELDDIDWSSLDWWSKYYASADKQEKKSNQTGNKETTVRVDDEGVSALITTQTGDQISLNSSGSDEYSHGHTDTDMTSSSANFKYIQTLTIYDKELESVKEFEGFAEWLHTFSLLRGKKTTDEEDDDSRIVGKFKGCLQIYKCPPMLGPKDVNIVGGDPAQGMFAGVPSNDPVKVLVRVYVVLAKELHPADLNGKADPYLVIKLGSKTINDVENYIPKQLNPVFGKCFEQEVTFPMESTLSVQIWDYDRLSKNDLIGETKIDLENRFYSRHRASCGLPSVYHSSGYNIWRDREKPTTILAKRCKASNMGPPHYRLHQAKVTVAGRDFFLKEDLAADLAASYDASHTEENLALNVLKQWHELQPGGCALVPEHVETRSLYNSEKPGIEQGKVQMWVDIFPLDAPALPPTIDISPRKPKGYELRVTIWNTDEVILEEDDFFTGEKSSDIYVKGWLTGPDNSQSTDVHYRSLTGEGNFNWRFVLAFDYLLAEQKIVVTKKDSIFSWDESETKMPAKLTLQVWDADHISADDFLGAFTGDLTRFPRGAKSMEACQLIDSTIPTVNIFKQKRIKGWWPFEQADGTIAGKVEAEIELVTAEDAEQRPVGLGREAPEPLEKPNRPDTAFLWFLNPLKSVQYLFCKRFKGICIKLFIAVALVMLIVLLVYNIPGYAAKRMLGA